MSGLLRASGVVAALLLLSVFAAPRAVADTVAFTWADARITSPVGLATDTDHSLYWTANSAADKSKTTVYAVNGEGRVGATLTYPQSTTGVIAVGYDSRNLYALDKSPKANTLRLSYMTLSSLVVSGSLPFHFYELVVPEAGQTIVALIVEPNSQFYVVAQSGHIYKAPAKASISGTNKLTKVSDGTAGVTGAYYDATQKAVVLRTASNIVVTDPASFATTGTIPAPAQTGARGIARALDGESYLLIGQGNGNGVMSVGGSTSTPSATPSATPSVTSTPSATPSPTEIVTSTPAAAGSFSGSQLFGPATPIAIGVAFVLALLAGVVAFGRR
jgi:hypothetical protein